MPGPDAPRPDPAPADRPAEAARSTVDAAGVRDAREIATRVAADEAAADAERARLLAEPLPLLDPEAHLSALLTAGELLHAVRRMALLERGPSQTPVGGTLYLTSSRLLHVATGGTTPVALASIADIAVALERLLLIGLADGSDLAIEVDQPRLLRVQLAAARAAARGSRS